VWYAAPPYWDCTSARPSQQSSFSGTRTAVTFQLAMARTEVVVTGPSKMPYPCTHWNSAPDRFTPCGTTVLPAASTSLLPATCSAGAPVRTSLWTKTPAGGTVVAVAVSLSYAFAVYEWTPGLTPARVSAYGAVVSVPTRVPPS